jgi:hypothetical protein
MSEGELSPWGSHLPALLACVAATDGPILEAGVGWNSTPMLHALCAPTERQLMSLDGNPEWLERFSHLDRPWHVLRHVSDWDHPPLRGFGEELHFVLAFVDHDANPRGPLLDILRLRCELVVMHDSETNYAGYSEPLTRWNWHWTHKSTPTWTTVAGMGPRPEWLSGAIPPGDWDLPVPYRG